MSDLRFRLIFKGVTQHTGLQKLTRILKKEFNLTDAVIKDLFTNPPRILWEVSARNDADMIRTALLKMGCLAEVESVVSYTSCAFSISSTHDRYMRKELSKVLRSRTSLALFLAKVESSAPEIILPSMMGSVTEEMGRYFRESDTILGVDDQYLIILAFSTDQSGADSMRHKIIRMIRELFSENAQVSIGYSLFPGSVRSFAELVSLAEKNRQNEINVNETAAPDNHQQSDQEINTATPKEKQVAELLINASGRVIKRLLSMDYQTLWAGLGNLPPQQQKTFLYRLPFDSMLAQKFKTFIETYAASKTDGNAEKHLEAIIHQVDEDHRSRSGRDYAKLEQRVLKELSQAESLAMLPAVASNVFRITSNPNSSTEEIASVIMNDPPLTAKLLKTVNSAYYGNVRKVHTVRDAVVLLGADEITDLAFGLAASKVFDKLAGHFINPRQLWRHSLITALIARNLVKGKPGFEKSGIMTAGLLHDTGKIFLIEHFQDIYEDIYRESSMGELSLIDLEKETFSMNHAEIGKTLCENWRLPEQLTDAIAYHHQPMAAAENRKTAAIIGLADYLAHAISGEESAVIPVKTAPPFLTMGHWLILKSVFEDLEQNHLPQMAEEAKAVIKIGHDLLAMF